MNADIIKGRWKQVGARPETQRAAPPRADNGSAKAIAMFRPALGRNIAAGLVIVPSRKVARFESEISSTH
jgi:hypothetical protein